MSQGSVLSFLEKNKGKKFTSREVADALDQGIRSTQNNIRKLYVRKFIKSDREGISDRRTAKYCVE